MGLLKKVFQFVTLYLRVHELALLASFFVLSFLLISPAYAQTKSGITYHGRILKPDGRPLEAANVQFRLQIRTPGAENCLLFEELQTKDMRYSNGVFSLTMSSQMRGNDEYAPGQRYTLERIFQNRGEFPVLADCQAGSGYIPNGADGRQFVVYFKDETMMNWEQLPPMSINFVPMALESRSVGGFNASHLLRVTDDGTKDGTPEEAPILSSLEALELKPLLNGTSSLYLKSVPSGSGFSLPSYTTTSPPTSLTQGAVWYDSEAKTLKYFDGSVQTVGTGTGSVLSITAGDGLTGGTITNNGTIALASVGTSGTYYKVTTDNKGRVTSGSTSLLEADIPNLSTAGKVSGNAITAGEIGGTTSINTSGTLRTSGVLSSASVSTRQIDLFDSDNSNSIRFQTPATGVLTQDYTLTLPASAGANGEVLATDGNGVLTWQSPTAGSVTAVTAQAPLSASTGFTPQISIAKSSATVDGYLAKEDWSTFNNAVQKAGDTMTGKLNLPANGLEVGAAQLVVDGGNVGIATSSPAATLDVGGAIITKAPVDSGAGPIDFGSGNLQFTSNSCGSYALHNMKSGGSYTLAVKGAASDTCSFTAFTDAGTNALTVHMPTDHFSTTAGKHTLYSFMVIGADVYVAWIPGL